MLVLHTHIHTHTDIKIKLIALISTRNQTKKYKRSLVLQSYDAPCICNVPSPLKKLHAKYLLYHC